MKSLTLINQTIRQHDGLYSLNDLHLASGGEEKHQPAFFLRNEQTKALIEELSSANLQTLKTVVGKGKAQGTYACKELVIAYAAWISAAFHLKVIGVFLDSVQKPQSLPPSQQVTEAAKVFKANFSIMRLIGCDKNAAAISANQATQKTIGINLLALNDKTHLVAENQESGYYTPSELGLRIGGLSGRKVNQRLKLAGLQTDENGQWDDTASGKPHSCWYDTGKKHGNGTPVRQLKWALSVLPFIQDMREAA